MKRKFLLGLVTGITGLTLLVTAQPTPGPNGQAAPAPLPGPSAQPGPPPGFQGGAPNFRHGARPDIYMRTIAQLQMTKNQLKRSPTDLGGHRDSALSACDKAIEELQAVRSYNQTNAPQMAPPPNAQFAPPPGPAAPAPAPPQ